MRLQAQPLRLAPLARRPAPAVAPADGHAMAERPAGDAPATNGAARKRRERARRSQARHVDWLLSAIAATRSHHTHQCSDFEQQPTQQPSKKDEKPLAKLDQKQVPTHAEVAALVDRVASLETGICDSTEKHAMLDANVGALLDKVALLNEKLVKLELKVSTDIDLLADKHALDRVAWAKKSDELNDAIQTARGRAEEGDAALAGRFHLLADKHANLDAQLSSAFEEADAALQAALKAAMAKIASDTDQVIGKMRATLVEEKCAREALDERVDSLVDGFAGDTAAAGDSAAASQHERLEQLKKLEQLERNLSQVDAARREHDARLSALEEHKSYVLKELGVERHLREAADAALWRRVAETAHSVQDSAASAGRA